MLHLLSKQLCLLGDNVIPGISMNRAALGFLRGWAKIPFWNSHPQVK